MKAAALVAAAGASSRMGKCKALLPFGNGVVFARRIAEVYLNAGCAPVVVTVPDAEADAVRAQLVGLPVLVGKNAHPEQGLTGSVMTALSHAASAEALLISPVDCPFVDVILVHTLMAALRRGVAAVPVVGDLRGHPAAFAKPAFELLWDAGNRGGPRAVLEALGDDVFLVPWSDPHVCEDVDTPDDYERLFGRSA